MKAGGLSATTGYVLSKVCKAQYSRAQALLDEIGLYRGQQFVLCRLWEEEGLTHSQLAERLHVHPATVTKTLRRMEQAGFIERRPDADDQRVSRVYLTDAGREI
ncbi:MAG: MarR family transcriptional regulator, partial [Chloroflexota bacterium]|nr:MarR family transcriptional regulator [Chloroflexota bacterium]